LPFFRSGIATILPRQEHTSVSLFLMEEGILPFYRLGGLFVRTTHPIDLNSNKACTISKTEYTQFSTPY